MCSARTLAEDRAKPGLVRNGGGAARGCTCRHAANGFEAIAQGLYNVVRMDCEMPGAELKKGSA